MVNKIQIWSVLLLAFLVASCSSSSDKNSLGDDAKAYISARVDKEYININYNKSKYSYMFKSSVQENSYNGFSSYTIELTLPITKTLQGRGVKFKLQNPIVGEQQVVSAAIVSYDLNDDKVTSKLISEVKRDVVVNLSKFVTKQGEISFDIEGTFSATFNMNDGTSVSIQDCKFGYMSKRVNIPNFDF